MSVHFYNATTGLVSSVLSFEERKDLSWAKELLPTSPLAAQGCSDPRRPALCGPHRAARQQDPRNCPMAHAHATVLAAQEEWQAETHQDGRAPALGPRQTACKPTSGRPSLQGFTHAPVGHQSTRRLRGTVPLALHHRTHGGERFLLTVAAADLDLVNMLGNAEWTGIRQALGLD